MKSGILPCLDRAIMVATSVQARGDCDVPIANWRRRDAVRAMADDRGWTLKRIQIDNGCYEIYGTDNDGRRFEAKINPTTLEIIEMKERCDHRRPLPPDPHQHFPIGGKK